MRGVTDCLLLDDALLLAVLIDFGVEKFSATISTEDFEVTVELGAKLIGVLDNVVGSFGLVL